MTQRANEIGAAGEHIACAMLLLAGHRATLAAAGLPYDIIADVNGRLVRVAVKSTAGPRSRYDRPGTKRRYVFLTQRRQRIHTGKCMVRYYSAEMVDVFALVALDIMRVAWIKFEDCPSGLWLEADTDQPGWRSGKRGAKIAGFDSFPLEAVL